MAPSTWTIPEGVRVRRDGSWCVGELPVAHASSLRYMKRRLVFEDEGPVIVDGPRRMPVTVEGPAFEVVGLHLDPPRGEARAVLDDGSEEPIGERSVGMNEETGRFECVARGGRARAVFTRAAHQALLDHVEQDEGEFFLEVGARRIAIRT